MYNWYIEFMIWSSFWKFRLKKILGKGSKTLEEHFLHFRNLKNMQFRNWFIYMQSSSLIGAELKKLLAPQKRERFPVGAGRAGSRP